jgi:hypothetical protein
MPKVRRQGWYEGDDIRRDKIRTKGYNRTRTIWEQTPCGGLWDGLNYRERDGQLGGSSGGAIRGEHSSQGCGGFLDGLIYRAEPRSGERWTAMGGKNSSLYCS